MKQCQGVCASAIGIAMAVGLLCDGVARAQPAAPRQQPVTFAPGASRATITGHFSGDETIDYVVRGAAGQTLTVTLTPSNRSSYFNVLPPDSTDVAMYVGQTSATYTGRLPDDGDYRIRVYLVRAVARRNAKSTFTLAVGVSGAALPPLPAAPDALVTGTNFHARSSITCVPAPYVATTPTTCEASVVRRGRDGTATVAVALGAAGRRRILFVKGVPAASDAAEPMTTTRNGDVTVVTFASGERHEIRDALLSGG